MVKLIHATNLKCRSLHPENLPLRLSSEAILKLVAETAYFRAEQRGFVPGYEIEDWLEAEKEIMARTESPVDKAN